MYRETPGFSRILLAFIAFRGCLSTDFDVTLIGFNSGSFECTGHSSLHSQDANGVDYPWLIWSVRYGNKKERPGRTGLGSGFCVRRSKLEAGARREVDALIKDVITNSSIRSPVNNTHLVCVAVSNRYEPRITWKAAGFLNETLSTSTFTIPSMVTTRRGCENGFKTVSSLLISDPSMAYQCVLDPETCSIRNQCQRRLLLDGRNVVIGDNGTSNDTLRCSTIAKGPCAQVLSNYSRLIISQDRIDGIVAKMQPRSRADLERICHLVYPKCLKEDPTSGFVPLCREDCYMLQYEYWKSWQNLTRHVANHFEVGQWNGCAQMPSVMDEGARCQQAKRKAFYKEKLRMDCYEENDRHYVGFVNTTASGHVCQRWDSLCPHHHDYWPDLYPELDQAENYCRNPRGLQSRPWCYTTDPLIRLVFCTVPQCTYSTPVTEEPATYSNPSSVLVAVGAGVLFSIASILIYVYRRRWTLAKARRDTLDKARFRRASKTSGEDAVVLERSSGLERDVSISDIPQNELYFRNERGIDRRLEPLEVPRSSWTVVERLAHGENNDVFLARLQPDFTPVTFFGHHRPRMLVVKMLKDSGQRPHLENFMHEACLVSECHHHRIVALLGVCFVTEPTCILFEYVPLGDLKTILEAEGAPDLDEGLEWLQEYRRNWDPPLGHPRRQLDICYQVSDGMVYLSNQRIVHRDLAARNVLVDGKLQTKISDFGLSKRVDSVGGIHIAPDGERLPVRWTAPEAWSRRHFSSKSDVWSFGVLVWEILSLGMQPYTGMSHQQVVHMVVNLRGTLSMESVMGRDPGEAYVMEREKMSEQLMKPCFAYNPEDRPDFIELLAKAAMLREMFKE